MNQLVSLMARTYAKIQSRLHRPYTLSGYKAFISYKHVTSTDFAVHLETTLKQYAKPTLARPIKIFRDEKHLAPGIDLPKLIFDALQASEFLIYLASPEAARSAWVEDEIKHWCGTLDRSDKLIILLLQGEIAVDLKSKQVDWSITNALPDIMMHYLNHVPFYLDLRSLSSVAKPTLGDPDFKRAINGIVSRFRGIDPNEMMGEEIRQHRRNVRLRNGGVAALGISTLVASGAAYIAVQRQELAERRARMSNARGLAAEARLALESSPARALSLAAEAIHTTTNAGERAEALALGSLYQAVGQAPGKVILQLDQAIETFDTFSDLSVFAAATNSGVVHFWQSGRAVEAIQTEHSSLKHLLAFSKTRSLLTVGEDSQMHLWSVAERPHKLLYKLPSCSSQQIQTILTSPDERWMATSLNDGSVCLYDMAKPTEPPQDLGDKKDQADRDIYFSPNSDHLLVVSRSSGMAYFHSLNAANGGHTLGAAIRVERGAVVDGGFVDEHQAILCGEDRSVFLLNSTPRFQPSVRRLTLPPCLELAVGRAKGTTSLLALLLPNRTLRFFQSKDGVNWEYQAEFALPGGRISGPMKFSRDGDALHVVVGNRLQSFYKLETSAWRRAPERVGHEKLISRFDVAPNDLVITAGRDGAVRLWNADEYPIRLLGHEDLQNEVYYDYGLAFHPSGKFLATGSSLSDGAVIWDMSRGAAVEQSWQLPAALTKISMLRFSKMGHILVGASASSVWGNEPPHVAVVWNLDNAARPTESWVLDLPSAPEAVSIDETESCVAVGMQTSVILAYVKGPYRGRRLKLGIEANSIASGADECSFYVGGSGTIRAISGKKGEIGILAEFAAGQEKVTQILLEPGFRWMAVGTFGGELWYSALDGDGEVMDLERVDAFSGWVTELAVSPDGMLLMEGGSDGRTRVWSTVGSTPKQVTALSGHLAAVSGVASVGQIIVTSSLDRTLRAWDSSDWTSTYVFDTSSGYFFNMVSLPEKKLIAVASYDGTISIWKVDLDFVLQQAASKAGRNLAACERIAYGLPLDRKTTFDGLMVPGDDFVGCQGGAIIPSLPVPP